MFLFSQNRRAGAKIVPAVLTRDRVHGIGAQLATLGGFRDSLQRLLAKCDLVHAHRSLDLESRHTRILADRAFVLMCHVYVLANDREGLT